MSAVNPILAQFKESPNYRIVQDFCNYLQYDRQVSERRLSNIIKFLKRYDTALNSKDFGMITRQDNQTYLLRQKKTDEIDPSHKWIGSYNTELADLSFFFRWLYNREKDPQDWRTPACVKIQRLKRVEDSPYTENDTWTQEDVLFVATKVAESPRDAFIVTALYDFAALNKDLTTLRLKNIKLFEKYGEATISAKGRFRTIPLIMSYPFARDLLNTHPFQNTPEAYAIVSQYNGKHVQPNALWFLTNRLRKKLGRMVEAGEFTGKDLEIAKGLLGKRWNPNLIGRHSSLSEKTEFMTDWQLRRYAGWSASSAVPKRYLHKRDVTKPLLAHYGIIEDEQGKQIIQINACSKCQYINKPNVKFCEKCSMVLSPEGYDEIKKSENELRDKVTQLEQNQKVFDSKLDVLAELNLKQGKEWADKIITLKRKLHELQGDATNFSDAELLTGLDEYVIPHEKQKRKRKAST